MDSNSLCLVLWQANSEAARLYQENRREYERKVKEIVEQSWMAEE